MSLETFKSLVPFVIDKTLTKKEFIPKMIFESLLQETTISEKDALFITDKAVRCVILLSGDVKYITAPMIREIVNSKLLQFGFEKERLEYTRIGFPFYDLKGILDKRMTNDGKEIDKEIVNHIIREFRNVENLIDQIINDKIMNGGKKSWLK